MSDNFPVFLFSPQRQYSPISEAPYESSQFEITLCETRLSELSFCCYCMRAGMAADISLDTEGQRQARREKWSLNAECCAILGTLKSE